MHSKPSLLSIYSLCLFIIIIIIISIVNICILEKSACSEMIEIDIDLQLSAFANARNMYSHKKAAHAKEVKTIDISAKVIQSVYDQTMKTMENQKISHSIRTARKV